jgi:1-acyl-sn-glycerol-3-phosphate acyltransferase
MARGFSPAALAAFELFFRPWMRRRLRGIWIAGPSQRLPPDRPVLLVANHTSWWDPFLIRELQRRLRPAAPLYSIMLSGELRRRPFFRRIGALGIDPQRPASVASMLRELQRRLRAHPQALVAFFPQGRIWPSQRRPLGFLPGVELLLRHLPPLTVLPVSLHLEPLASPAPSAFVLAGEPLASHDPEIGAARLEREVEHGLDRLHSLLSEWGEAAPDVWPRATESLHGARL